jgi:hypothetical protein
MMPKVFLCSKTLPIMRAQGASIMQVCFLYAGCGAQIAYAIANRGLQSCPTAFDFNANQPATACWQASNMFAFAYETGTSACTFTGA